MQSMKDERKSKLAQKLPISTALMRSTTPRRSSPQQFAQYHTAVGGPLTPTCPSCRSSLHCKGLHCQATHSTLSTYAA